MAIELEKNGLTVEAEKPITVFYSGINVGNYFADLVVDDKIIIEVKKVKSLNEKHIYQLKHYLAATDNDTGILLNFNHFKVDFKRVFKD